MQDTARDYTALAAGMGGVARLLNVGPYARADVRRAINRIRYFKDTRQLRPAHIEALRRIIRKRARV